LGGVELIRRLGALGYEATRQTSSHVRVTRTTPVGQHHVTVPTHKSLRVGTLNSILADVAAHLGRDKDEVIAELFG
jgi:predicted RNA binding protein YcfA (HicA-like mRNA interferase family)